jgi:hypothetical protein
MIGLTGAIAPLAPTRIHPHSGRPTNHRNWSVADDNRLIHLVNPDGPSDWAFISHSFPGKSQQQVIERWTKVLDPRLTKGAWTGFEDRTVIAYVEANGPRQWSKLAKLMPGRLGKMCRERWVNHLDPAINHSPFTPEEDQKIIELRRQFGSQWVKIASLIPSRTSNAIKNRWNSQLSRSQPQQPGLEAGAQSPGRKEVDPKPGFTTE